MTNEPISTAAASAASDPIGWRVVLGALAASVTVSSLSRGLLLAGAVGTGCGDDADGHLRVDVRSDRVDLRLQTASTHTITSTDVELARRIAEVVHADGLAIAAPTAAAGRRPVQALEIAIDTLDRAAILPFWRAVLSYVDQPGSAEPDALVDPVGQGPMIWFQQMDEPRPQRNRIHLDVSVPPDEAAGRISAALAAGGSLLSDTAARAFWVLADAEGNEACVCTWQDRGDG